MRLVGTEEWSGVIIGPVKEEEEQEGGDVREGKGGLPLQLDTRLVGFCLKAASWFPRKRLPLWNWWSGRLLGGA